MTISVWRYSHLALAISSFVFVAIAAISGIALSFEPISSASKGYPVAEQGHTIASLIPQLMDHYEEVFNIQVDDQGFVSVSAIDLEGNMGEFYIDPVTGEKLAKVQPKSDFFEFMTSLHRSLFLKGLGRFFVGLACFLLFLITVTGIVLVVKRQQGLRYFFSKIIRENFYQYYHIYLGRLGLIPILIITLTGTYLTLQRFEVIPEAASVQHEIDYEALSSDDPLDKADFPVFQETKLTDIRQLEFPFSTDVEDFFTLRLQDRELVINQLTGEVVSASGYPVLQLISELSLVLHTGRGNSWWAIILGLSSASILFFIYSGFKLIFKRRAVRFKNKLGKNDCEYIILVGSETGTTLPFAMQLHMALLEEGKRSYITELNRFETFGRMQHLIVLTSTYGQGEAPANADRFVKLYEQNRPKGTFSFSVVGFGSLAYPDFCRFAEEVDQLLADSEKARRVLPMHAINNRSWESFRQWARDWSEGMDLSVHLPTKNPAELSQLKIKSSFEVLSNTKAANHPDDSFLMELRPTQKTRMTSGDLMAIYTPDDPHERLYSMAITAEGNILLSIKRHEFGICSNYLNDRNSGDRIEASIVRNKHFHFPKKASGVVMIGTGTGMAPFLGMLENNEQQIETRLYWGGRTRASYGLYQRHVEASLLDNRLKRFVPAYSREGDYKIYVQDRIREDEEFIAKTLREKGIVMICGSITMQREVIDILEELCFSYNNRPLSYYQKRNQLRMDCY